MWCLALISHTGACARPTRTRNKPWVTVALARYSSARSCLRCPAEQSITGRRRNCRLVLPLDGRIGNLKDIEDAHRDVIFQIRKGAGHPDEPHFAGVLQ